MNVLNFSLEKGKFYVIFNSIENKNGIVELNVD